MSPSKNIGFSFFWTFLCPTVFLCAISLECFSAICYAIWGIGVAMLLPGVAIVLLYRGRRRGVRSYTRTGLTLLWVAGFSVMLHWWIVGIQEGKSMADGDVVCEALSAFKEDNNRFPEELAQLIPDYLERLPTTSMGLLLTRPFFYDLNDWSGGYTLGFRTLNWTNWERDEAGDWSQGF